MPTATIRGWERETLELDVWRQHEDDPALKAEIEYARKMIGAGADGCATYSEATFNRAAAFLTMYSDQLFKCHGLVLPGPRIGPGPEGSVDLYWKHRSRELLMNIPADANEPAAFYGDDYRAQKFRGQLDVKTFNLGFAHWLIS